MDQISGACPLCWEQLAAVLGGVKLYYGSSILIKNYPTLSAAIGRWDGVDAKQTRFVCTFLFGKHHQGLVSWRRGAFNRLVLAYFLLNLDILRCVRKVYFIALRRTFPFVNPCSPR